MVHISIDEKINDLKQRLLQENTLGVCFYYFLCSQQDQLKNIDFEEFVGEAERIAALSFSGKFPDWKELEKVYRRINLSYYRNALNIFERIALYKEDKESFSILIDETLTGNSIRYKFLIAKAFPKDFEEKLKSTLRSDENNQDPFAKLLKHIYLNYEIGQDVLNHFIEEETLDIDDLILLEDYQKIKAYNYHKLQEKLFNDILWASVDIQSKHRSFNNSEDQYNTIYQTILTAKGYTCSDQTQRGESYGQKQVGELDLLIFDSSNMPLSIFEAFKIDSIDSDYITLHLKKLTENYDSNGLKINYAVIYALSPNFLDLWQRYKSFVANKIDFKYPISSEGVEDISSHSSNFSDIKIGKAEHLRAGKQLVVYHFFINMFFAKHNLH